MVPKSAMARLAGVAVVTTLMARVAHAERASKPNIVFFLTDDQDQILGGSLPPHAPGGATPIPYAQKQLSEGGATFTNMFIHTPICCPSRSEMATGRYLHNLKTPGQCPEGYSGKTSDGNYCCMHVDEGHVHPHSFATKLSAAGYKVGAFGKYLNSYDDVAQTIVPPGFSAWLVNGGGQYNSPMFHANNVSAFDKSIPDGVYHAKGGYTTAVVGNVSVGWIDYTVKNNPGSPFFAYVGPKAAHEPFTPAPWYTNYWAPDWPAGAPQPPSYNCSMASRSTKVSHVAVMDMISDTTAACIDQTFQDRWRTLMSVDDVIQAVVQKTKDLGVYDNTYFMYSSDHGFQLGEMNLAMDKRNVYDFDVRIHLVVSGPGIKPGTIVSQLATNVDLTPTWWGLAGIDVGPDDVDGKSLAPLFMSADMIGDVPISVEEHIKTSPPKAAVEAGWRDSAYIEYYYVGIDNKCSQKHPIEAIDNNFIAIRLVDHPQYGDVMYAEYESGEGGSANWTQPSHYEYYEMISDPWQLDNVYGSSNMSTRQYMHQKVQAWLHCQGSQCP